MALASRRAVVACKQEEEPRYTATSRPLKFWQTSANVKDNPFVVTFAVLALFAQLSTPLIIGLEKLGLIELPPLNAFTAITNAALDAKIAEGSLNQMMATAWGQGFYFDLIKQFYDSGEANAEFVGRYCMAAEHYDWCMTAKEVVARWDAGLPGQ